MSLFPLLTKSIKVISGVFYHVVWVEMEAKLSVSLSDFDYALHVCVGYFVIPGVCEVTSLTLAHFVKHGNDFIIVIDVNGRVDGEICCHGLYSSNCIFRFFREVSKKCCLEFHGSGSARQSLGLLGEDRG